jgi:hypothetical protein
MLGDIVGRGRYIDQKHGRFREVKAASGWWLTGTGLGACDACLTTLDGGGNP